MPRSMTPLRGFWFGVVLTLIGLAVGMFLITAMLALGGQALASNDFVRVVGSFGSVMLPLGMTFIALSLVARALQYRPGSNVAQPEEDLEPSFPPRVSSRIALMTGLVLLVIGLVFQLYLVDWMQSMGGDATFLRDFVVYLGPPLSAVMLPLGVLLIPCAWILRIIEERQISVD